MVLLHLENCIVWLNVVINNKSIKNIQLVNNNLELTYEEYQKYDLKQRKFYQVDIYRLMIILWVWMQLLASRLLNTACNCTLKMGAVTFGNGSDTASR